MQRNMRELYDTTKKLAGKYKQSSRPMRDKGGKILTKKEDQLTRWAEHFEELLNRPGGRFSNVPETFRTRKAISKTMKSFM